MLQRPAKDLKAALGQLAVDTSDCLERADFVSRLLKAPVRDVRTALEKLRVDVSDCIERQQLLDRLLDATCGRHGGQTSEHVDRKSDAPPFQPGTFVRLVGLRGAPELNTRRATVVRQMPGADRCEVRLDGDGGVKMVRWANLRTEEEPRPTAGDGVGLGKPAETADAAPDGGAASPDISTPRVEEPTPTGGECVGLGKPAETADAAPDGGASSPDISTPRVEEPLHGSGEGVDLGSPAAVVPQRADASADGGVASPDLASQRDEENAGLRREMRVDEHSPDAAPDAPEIVCGPETVAVAATPMADLDAPQREDVAPSAIRSEHSAAAVSGSGVPALDRSVEEEAIVEPRADGAGPSRSEADSPSSPPMRIRLREDDEADVAGTTTADATSPCRVDTMDYVGEAAPDDGAAMETTGGQTIGACAWTVHTESNSKASLGSSKKPMRLKLGRMSGCKVKNIDAEGGRMLAGVQALFLARELCDARLVCNGNAYPAHKVVLAGQSEVFRELFRGLQSEVHLDMISKPEAVTLMLDYLYDLGGRGAPFSYAPSSHAVNVDVLRLAERFQLHGLRQHAAVVVARDVTTHNAVERLGTCDAFNLPDIRERILKQIASNKRALAEFTDTSGAAANPKVLHELLLRVSGIPQEVSKPTPKKKARK